MMALVKDTAGKTSLILEVPSYWEQAKAPCHPDAATAVGTEIAIVVARLLRPTIRAPLRGP